MVDVVVRVWFRWEEREYVRVGKSVSNPVEEAQDGDGAPEFERGEVVGEEGRCRSKAELASEASLEVVEFVKVSFVSVEVGGLGLFE